MRISDYRVRKDKMGIKNEFRKLLWKTGYDIHRLDPNVYPLARKIKLLELCHINLILDVGANTGQFAKHMRMDAGFSGRIVSFEPLTAAFELLKSSADKDPSWKVFHFALGDAEGQRLINIAQNSVSSSLLEMLPSHSNAAPGSNYVGNELAQIKTLDSLFDQICSKDENIYLKIDTQGFEKKVISGARNSLAHIDTIELEMSLEPLYRDELLFHEMYNLLGEKNYKLVLIEPVYFDEDFGPILQINGVFHRF
jgi:FkbM family methyltransferase